MKFGFDWPSGFIEGNIVIIYMLLAPGQGQTTLWGQLVFININNMSICPFLASFALEIFHIQMHGRPKSISRIPKYPIQASLVLSSNTGK